MECKATTMAFYLRSMLVLFWKTDRFYHCSCLSLQLFLATLKAFVWSSREAVSFASCKVFHPCPCPSVDGQPVLCLNCQCTRLFVANTWTYCGWPTVAMWALRLQSGTDVELGRNRFGLFNIALPKPQIEIVWDNFWGSLCRLKNFPKLLFELWNQGSGCRAA